MSRRITVLLMVCISVRAAPGDPASLQIRIVEGDGVIYSLGSRATRGITVEVTNETGKPVEGVPVTFQLPDEGAGGTFPNASKTQIATTGSDGRVSVWGMLWNRTAGSFEVRVTATKGDARAGTVCQQSLAAGPERAARRTQGSHRWLWVGLVAVAGGAGAAVAIRGRDGSASPAVSAVSLTSIGAPTIAIGPQR